MNQHRHLSSEEICLRVSEGGELSDIAGCEPCEAEASSLSQFLGELQRTDAARGATTDWDELLMRSRIREALAKEKPHVRSIFDRFAVLRPAFASALLALIALVAWSPLSRIGDTEGVQVASGDSGTHERLPAWTPLPDESEDEALAVLAEWKPNEDELAIAGCRSACLSGLSDHEEESLLLAVARTGTRLPVTAASPL